MTALVVAALFLAIGILVRAGFGDAKEETLVRSAVRRARERSRRDRRARLDVNGAS